MLLQTPFVQIQTLFVQILDRTCRANIWYKYSLYKYLIENNILNSKQFGFQNVSSTDHALVLLVDKIIESIENNEYTIGVFIDLPKAFYTVFTLFTLHSSQKIGTI